MRIKPPGDTPNYLIGTSHEEIPLKEFTVLSEVEGGVAFSFRGNTYIKLAKEGSPTSDNCVDLECGETVFINSEALVIRFTNCKLTRENPNESFPIYESHFNWT